MMCVYQYGAAWPTIGYLVFWFIEGDLKRKGNAIIKNKYVLLFAGFYLLYAISMLFTYKSDNSLSALQVKLSLFVFPLLLVSEGEIDIKKQKMFIYSFIVGCVVTGLICIGYATWNLFANNIFEFQYMKYSILLHPSYYSMYIDVAMVFVFYLFTTDTTLSKLEKSFLVFSILFLLFTLVLLQSKMGMFISAGVFALLLVRYALMRSYKTVAWLLGAMLIVYFSSFHFLIGGRSRVVGAADIIKTNQISAGSTESTQVRYYVWKAALEVIKEHPIVGVGTGNSSEVLVKQYLQDGYTGAAKENLNAHNQYLQTTVVMGVVGLLTLLACLLFPFIKTIKEKRFVYGMFLAIIAVNFLVEAMLETQSGTIFYGLFNSLLMFNFVI